MVGRAGEKMICNYSFYKPLLNEAIMQQCHVVSGFSLTPTLSQKEREFSPVSQREKGRG
jgi:hypothetical protein